MLILLQVVAATHVEGNVADVTAVTFAASVIPRTNALQCLNNRQGRTVT